MEKTVEELAAWFVKLPNEIQYKFSAQWIAIEASGVSQGKLILKAENKTALIKMLQAYDVEKDAFKKGVKWRKAGIKLDDISLLCHAINAHRKTVKQEKEVSPEAFYNQAWEKLSQQPLKDTQTLLDDFANMLKNSALWTTVQPILRRSQNIDIRELYVDIRLLTDESQSLKCFSNRDFTSANDYYQQNRARQFIKADSLLDNGLRRNVLVGPPGSGKSTLLRWLCVYLLRRKQYPVPIQLKRFSDEMVHNGDLSFLAFAWKQLAAETDNNPLTSIHNITDFARFAKDKRIIYLLDGWDEVPLSMHSLLRPVIDRETANNCTLITSRQSGIPDLLQDGKTTFYEFGPLTDYAIANLCRRYGEQRGATHLMPEILSRLEHTPSLWPVVRNPYLLTLFCEVFFKHKNLPKYQVCSPYWMMAEAIKLMTDDHNYEYPRSHKFHLERSDIKKIEDLAYELSFGKDEKNSNFDPAFMALFPENDFADSSLAASHFFKASRTKPESSLTGQVFEFSHLRLQEFFAAKSAISSGLSEKPEWIERKILSSLWREEVSFMGAILVDENSKSIFWLTISNLLTSTDISGEILRRAANILTVAGVEDGGLTLLGCDVREQLWHLIKSMQVLLDENLFALLQLDAAFLEQKLYEDEIKDSLLTETISRKNPTQFHRILLNEKPCEHQECNWPIGSLVRTFPTKEIIDELILDALNEELTGEQRIAALRDLGVARAVECVKPLIHLMNDDSVKIANAVIESLSYIGGHTVAKAMAKLLVKIPTRNELTPALLKALSVSGSGILEPHSRKFLIFKLSRLPSKHKSLYLALTALESSPLPWPPKHLIKILSQSGDYSEELRAKAASVFHGITDAAFLSKALDTLQYESSENVRTQLVKACPFIPINYEEVTELWEQFLTLSQNTQETSYTSHLLQLFLRSLHQFGNHPISELLTAYMALALDKLLGGDESTLYKLVLKHAELLHKRKNSQNTEQKLLNIAVSSALSEETRVLAVSALAQYQLEQSIIDTLFSALLNTIHSGHTTIHLSKELVITLFTCRPALAPSLIKLAQSVEENICIILTSPVLTKAHQWGYLIYSDYVIGPDGQKVSV